jgi:hypothetical protein
MTKHKSCADHDLMDLLMGENDVKGFLGHLAFFAGAHKSAVVSHS